MLSRTKLQEIKERHGWDIAKASYMGLKILMLWLALFLINHTLIGLAVVHGESMEPTLWEGDVLLCQKFPGFEPCRNDVVLCRTGKGYENELVKRVVGLPGDEINIQEDGTVYVNGKPETVISNKEGNRNGDVSYPLTVPQGQYYVMGDNRAVSLDSRYSGIGTIPLERIDGKVLFCIFSPRVFRKIN